MALMFTIPNRRFSTLFSFCNLEVLVGTRTWNSLQFDNVLARQVNTWEKKWLWSDGVGSGSRGGSRLSIKPGHSLNEKYINGRHIKSFNILSGLLF
jgi:hypothetical protein